MLCQSIQHLNHILHTPKTPLPGHMQRLSRPAVHNHGLTRNCVILVLSPYKAQVAKLKTACFGIPFVMVNTIDSAQGTEADIVILSLV